MHSARCGCGCSRSFPERNCSREGAEGKGAGHISSNIPAAVAATRRADGTLHRDIREDAVSEAFFAVNLSRAIVSEGPEEYRAKGARHHGLRGGGAEREVLEHASHLSV